MNKDETALSYDNARLRAELDAARADAAEAKQRGDIFLVKLDNVRAILGCEPDCTLYDRAVAAVREIQRLGAELEQARADAAALIQMADEWGAGKGMGIPAAEFERRYGYHEDLVSTMRAHSSGAAILAELAAARADAAAMEECDEN